MKLENSITGNEDLQEKLVAVNRVAKVVKGSRQSLNITAADSKM